LLEEAMALAATPWRRPQFMAYLSEVRLREHRAAAAAELAARAFALAREYEQRGIEAWILRLRGEIAAHRDPPDARLADSYYRQARVPADDLGMRPLVTHCHLGLGKLYQRAGKRNQAREHLTAATTMYREMEMTFWLEKAEAQMRELA